jgi:hypothetical protein
MKILVPALLVSGASLFLLYRALFAWAQNHIRNAMYGEGRAPCETLAIRSVHTDVPQTALQDHDKIPLAG